MSRGNHGSFSIGKRKAPSQQRFTPTVRGVTGASPSLAQGSSRSPMPGLRTNGGGRRGVGNHTPGLRGRSQKKNDRLGPAQGKVLSEGRVNGIHVRVSAPRARPDGERPGVIDTKARERHISPDAPPELMASQSTQMIAGQDTPRRSQRGQNQQQQQRGGRRRPQVQQLPQEPEHVIETTAEEKPPLPPGAYWSDKYDSYIEPGDERYSEETAQRMGALG